MSERRDDHGFDPHRTLKACGFVRSDDHAAWVHASGAEISDAEVAPWCQTEEHALSEAMVAGCEDGLRHLIDIRVKAAGGIEREE